MPLILDPMDPQPEVRLSVAAVAQRLGIAPATLRTWDRRYGLGPSEHLAGTHRRYGEQDLRRLRAMRQLVLQGVTPAEAARHALGSSGQPPAKPGRHGGRVLPLPEADDVVRGLARAAMALDADALTGALTEHLGRHGVVPTWEGLIAPLLVSVGQRWEKTGEGVEVEHLVSDCVSAALTRHQPGCADAGRPVLLACAPDDLHTLPLQAVGAGLAERGVASRMLGASVPADALAAATRHLRPSAVMLWSQTPATGGPDPIAALPVTRPATVVVVGGPGWRTDLPAVARRASSLGAALDLLDVASSAQALASSG